MHPVFYCGAFIEWRDCHSSCIRDFPDSKRQFLIIADNVRGKIRTECLRFPVSVHPESYIVIFQIAINCASSVAALALFAFFSSNPVFAAHILIACNRARVFIGGARLIIRNGFKRVSDCVFSELFHLFGNACKKRSHSVVGNLAKTAQRKIIA